MINAIYVTLSNELALTKKLEAIGNNIANSETIGYKTEAMLFEKMLVDTKNKDKLAFVNDVAMSKDLSNGPINNTGKTFDLAIDGDGYFVVETLLGKRYTRAGNFTLNENGELINSNGYNVLSADGQPIIFTDPDAKIEIAADGTVMINGEGSQKLDVVKFEKAQFVTKVGNSLLTSDIEPEKADDFTVVQGAVEGSNVVPFRELTSMIETERSFVNSTKLIAQLDELLRSTIQRLGRVA